MIDRSETMRMRKWWLEELMTCTHENFLYNTGNVNRSCQNHVILYCDQNLCWCAPSGVRVRLFEPAPRELKARKTPSKIKSKETPKTRKIMILNNVYIHSPRMMDQGHLPAFQVHPDLKYPANRRDAWPGLNLRPIKYRLILEIGLFIYLFTLITGSIRARVIYSHASPDLRASWLRMMVFAAAVCSF